MRVCMQKAEIFAVSCIPASPPICQPGLLLESKTHYRIAGNFREELQAIREIIIICECLVFVDKDRAIALIRKKNIIREMLYLVHSRKFYFVKISHYSACPHRQWEAQSLLLSAL